MKVMGEFLYMLKYKFYLLCNEMLFLNQLEREINKAGIAEFPDCLYSHYVKFNNLLFHILKWSVWKT